MNNICEKTTCSMTDDIKEIKSDIKILLAHHHKNLGERRLKKTFNKIFIAVVGLITAIIGYIKIDK